MLLDVLASALDLLGGHLDGIGQGGASIEPVNGHTLLPVVPAVSTQIGWWFDRHSQNGTSSSSGTSPVGLDWLVGLWFWSLMG